MRKNKFVKRKKPIKSWKALLNYYDKKFSKEKWLFRGDNPDRGDNLGKVFKSSLDKAFEGFKIIKQKKKSKIEQALIKEFRRKERLYTNDKSANWLECLALMQHHGTPTRLLDWTYSFFAAVYFAINRATEGSCVIWALNNDWLHNKDKECEDQFIDEIVTSNDRTPGSFKATWPKVFKSKEWAQFTRDNGKRVFENIMIHYLLKKNEKFFIYAVNPYYMNERLSIQQGVLLCSGNTEQSWGENLDNMLEDDKQLWKIEIGWDKNKPTLQKEILEKLYEMNINQATLFPDLDGFAESLRTRIAHPGSLGLY